MSRPLALLCPRPWLCPSTPPGRFSQRPSFSQKDRWQEGPRGCVVALAHWGRGFGGAPPANGRLSPRLLPCAAVCSKWCWFPSWGLCGGVAAFGSKPEGRVCSVLRRKEFSASLQGALILVTQCLFYLFHFGKLRFDGNSRFFFNF